MDIIIKKTSVIAFWFGCIYLYENCTLRIICIIPLNHFVRSYKLLFVFLYDFPINYLTLVRALFKNLYFWFV